MVGNTEVVTDTRQNAPAQLRGPVARLILGSTLMLFLELALIRWLGANVVHLSYFTNFVLLGSFLGIGVPPPAPAWGSMIAEARIPLMAGKWVPVAAPAVPIALTVFAFNLLGDWLRIRLDPTQRNL